MDEEQYLSSNGASRQSIGEAALHKNRGRLSDKSWRRIVKAQLIKDVALLAKTEALREEYLKKIADGTVRPPSRIEKLIMTASGHKDNAATKAARRILAKKGIIIKGN